MANSRENLRKAFQLESIRTQQYRAYAERARREGNEQRARLFAAASEASSVMALNHFRSLFPSVDTPEDLREAVRSESQRGNEVYPPMLETAQAEGDQAAEWTFTYASEVTKRHAELFGTADSSSSGAEAKEREAAATLAYFVCPTCGYIAEAEAPESCPVCGTPGGRFREVT
jgi:rubrerythrin